jgi:hypothetical protein
MNTKRVTIETSSSLGTNVRRLARDAQSWRGGLDRDETERLRLVCRIDRLACTLEGESHQPLRRWLENLRRDLSRDASSVLSV